MLKHLAIAAVLMGLAGPAVAADGGACSSVATDFDTVTVGRMVPIWCVVLCDNLTTNAACTNYDLKTAGGIPDVIAFELHEVDIDVSGGAGDCTAGTVTINTSFNSGLTTASENAFDLGASTALVIGTLHRISQDNKTQPVDRYIMATSTNLDANCTNDGVDILMIGYEEKKGN